jgi:hypothetical protein
MDQAMELGYLNRKGADYLRASEEHQGEAAEVPS